MLNRIDLILAETGALVDYNIELRQLLYLSDAVADRVEKRKKAIERQKMMSKGK